MEKQNHIIKGEYMQLYTEEELNKIHQIEEEALEDFTKVCQKYGLSFFLTAGAALGAIRHGGPIPWDDDIDLGMLRDDYEKFLSIAQMELGDKYTIRCPENTEDYPIFVINISRNNTIFQRDIYMHLSFVHGICMDIFPFDYVSENKKERARQIRKAWFWNKILILKNMPQPQVPGKGIVNKAILFICLMINIVLKIPLFSRKLIKCKFNAVATKNNNKTNMITSFSETYPEKIKLNLEDVFPLKEVKFGNIKSFVPKNYDKMLTNEYGDYMKIPPIENRKSDRPYRLKFIDENN
jgi:lipopolysaccharide cholinephosphotransferase